MSATAAILLTIAAVTHAGWNLIGKRHHSSAVFLAAGVIGLIVLLPFPVLFYPIVFDLPAGVWRYLALSGIFQAVYYVSLAEAYKRGEMSTVYPLARSLPAVFVALLAVVLGTADRVSLGAILGIFLIILGACVLPMLRFGLFPRTYATSAFGFAVVAALGTAGYSRTDDAALRLAWHTLGSEFPGWQVSAVYAFLEGVTFSLWLAFYALLRRSDRAALRKLFGGGVSSFRGAALIGIGIYATYAIVLVSMEFVREVSYVVAFRQLSIPIGAATGILLLKERRSLPKMVGIVLMIAGVLLVGIS